MAKQKYTAMLWAWVFAFVISLGSIGCLTTGMRMQCHGLWLVCAAGSLFWVVCLRFRLTIGALGAFALAGGYLWRKGLLEQAAEKLLFDITTLYDKGYGTGILRWTEADLTTADPSLALWTLALAVSLVVAMTVMGRQKLWACGLASLVPLGVCLVLTDTVPQDIYLYLLLAGLILLLLTQSIRRQDATQGDRLAAMALVPVALAVALLFVCVPREGYDGQQRLEKIEDLFYDLFYGDPGSSNTPAVGDIDDVYSLRGAGPLTDRHSLVMRVKAEETATLYLRGCSYDYYNGESWEARQGAGSWDMDFHGTGEEKTLTISTPQPHSVLYFTYAPEDLPRMAVNGRVKNVDKVTEYTVSYRKNVAYNQVWDIMEMPVPNGDILQYYLQLPEATKAAATELLKSKVGFPTPTENAGQIWKNANIIADFVGSRGTYDLETGPMPLGEPDFALWFLNEADTGYCVHYATATVVLLRAAGIPARYVSGYLVNTRAGQNTQVRLRQAHAWAECYINGYGWVVLESTPAGGGSPVEEQEETVESTVATEQTTAPTEEALPTAPHQTQTRPTAPKDDTGVEKNPVDLGWLLDLLVILAVLAAVLIQWQVRVALRRKRLRSGRPNARALRHYQEAVLLAKLLRQPLGEELVMIAQEAKFSLHTVTAEQLRQLEEYLRTAKRQLRQHPVWKRVYYTVILALW